MSGGSNANMAKVCLVPGCGTMGTVGHQLCRHHYDHRYDHYRATGEVLTMQQMADHPRKRRGPKPGKYPGRTIGGKGEPMPNPDAPLNPVLKVDLRDPEVRKHTMVAMSDEPKLENAYAREEIPAKSDISPSEEKISPPPLQTFSRQPRRPQRDIKREILIERLDWLQKQVSLTIRELLES